MDAPAAGGPIPETPTCPRCATPVQPTWDWCHACGWDPDNLRPSEWMGQSQPGARREPPPNPGGAASTVLQIGAVVVVAIVAIGVVGYVVATGRKPAMPVYAAASNTTDGWTTATSPDGTYSIEFPGTPQSGTTTSGTTNLTYLAWKSSEDPTYAAFGGVVGPHDPAREQGALDRAVTSAAKDAQITSTITVPFESHAARAFSGTLTGGVPLKGLAFFSGNSIYLLIVAGPIAIAQADKFFNSFTATS